MYKHRRKESATSQDIASVPSSAMSSEQSLQASSAQNEERSSDSSPTNQLTVDSQLQTVAIPLKDSANNASFKNSQANPNELELKSPAQTSITVITSDGKDPLKQKQHAHNRKSVKRLTSKTSNPKDSTVVQQIQSSKSVNPDPSHGQGERKEQPYQQFGPPPPPLLNLVMSQNADDEPLAKPVANPTVKPLIDSQDLLNRKRLLRRVDRMADYNPVTLSRLELFEKEYEKVRLTPPEYLPLHLVKQVIVSQNSSADLVNLNFNGIDQVTDYLFPLIYGGGTSAVNSFKNLKKLNLVGCIHITDQGLKWIARLFPDIQMIEVNACRKVTEKGLHSLFISCKNLQNLSTMACNVSSIPDSITQTRLLQGNLQWAGNPILSDGKAYGSHQGHNTDDYHSPLKRKVLILRCDGVDGSMINLFTNSQDNKIKCLSYLESFQITSKDSSHVGQEAKTYDFNIFEISASDVLRDSLATEGSIVVLAYTQPSNSSLMQESAEKIADIISSVIIKCSDVVFLLVEMSETGEESNMTDLVRARFEYLTKGLYAATYQLYQRNWHYECLDFKAQQGLGCGIASLESLEEITQADGIKMKTVCVTKTSFQSLVTSALCKCAEDVKTIVPWVHTEWPKQLTEAISKFPKLTAATQASLFTLTDDETRNLFPKVFSFPKLGKVLNLLQNWGAGLYLWHQHKSLCVTHLKGYEKLLNKLTSATPPDKVKVISVGQEVPCWKLDSMDAWIQSEKLDVKVSDALALLKRQGILLKMGCQLVEKIPPGQFVFVRTADLPESHTLLENLWPEPSPKQRMFQINRCYNLLPTIPAGFMSKLFRTILKVFRPVCIWKTGFLLRQGPVDIKASLHRYQGGNFDGTPVLVLSARVLDIRKDLDLSSSSTEIPTSVQQAHHLMFSCLRQVMLVVDSVCLKTKVYACITLPCQECTENSMGGILNLTQNRHLPYYIAIASKTMACRKHPHINPMHLYDAQEDQSGKLVPLHNYPYHIEAVTVIDDAIRAERHRPMDAQERCFYCGEFLDVPCLHCGICAQCTHHLAKLAKTVQPGHITSKSFKLQRMKDGEMKDDERILSNTKGSVYFYKKGHRMQLLPAMTPFYWDEIFITTLRGANFYLHLTFGSGKTIEYHGQAGVLIDQNGKAHQNDLWMSRDANLINIKLECVKLGQRVRVVIFLKGLECLSEEVDGWHMKLDLNSEKPGTYIIHTPGIKEAWQLQDNKFNVGSILEVAEDGNTSHTAVILEKSDQGYLKLDINGQQRQYVFTSPQLMPVGTTQALGKNLASEIPNDENNAIRSPVPLTAFLKYQVPCGFSALMKGRQSPGDQGPQDQTSSRQLTAELISSCIAIDLPSSMYTKQVRWRDSLEKIMFTDGKWNFPMTALLMLPASLTKEDLIVCSQQRLTEKFKLHPLCCFRADVNTVASVGPCAPQLPTLECFHNVHMVDNPGFEPKVNTAESEQSANTGTWLDVMYTNNRSSLAILWAWMVLLLRLQKDSLTQFNALTSNIAKIDNLSPHQINKGLFKVVELLSQVLLFGLGKDFDYKTTITEEAVEQLKELMIHNGETQCLVKMLPPFSDDYLLMCESHRSSWQVNKGLEHFSEVPGLYPQFIYSLNLSGNNLSELPPLLFTTMGNLKDLSVSGNMLKSLPNEIGNCKQLVTLSVSENCLTKLPHSLKRCQELTRLDIDKNNFAEFPGVILKLKNLTRLYAQHLQLPSLPENVGDLNKLEILSLSGNCLTSLPDSMRNLQQLTTLSLNGVMWVKSRSNSLLSKENFEDFLRVNNLAQWLERHNQDKFSIFRLFDQDTNGTLDSREIGKLNATMFYVFPRLGYTGKDPPDDDTPSGFPEILCELKNLQYLSLQYHGIVTVPDDIKKLTKLCTLHLGNNPNLLTISAQLGSLPLKRVELEACPRLKTPPKEIRAKGFITTLAYLKRLLTGSVSCQRTKLMLVGLGGAGKTSLVKALLSDNKKTPLNLGDAITDGIDICPWTVKTKEGEITYSVWDFAGQTVYYNTHQFFLSDRAVYLLLWNIRLGHEHAGLHFWLSSISVHAPKAPIFVVGTHLDQMSKVELPLIEMEKKYPQIRGFHFISSHTGQGIQELQEQLLEVTLQQQYMGEKIPGVWLSFEESIKSMQDKSVIEYKELENKAYRSGIFDATEVAHAVQFLHELGSLQHFTNANLRSHVVVNPQWIVDVMACVVSVKDSHIKDGKLHHSDVAKVWKDYDSSLHKWLLMLTEEFDLTFPLKDVPIHLVPCLLPEIQPKFVWPEVSRSRYNKETQMIYKFDYLPAGLFNRGQVRLHQFSDSDLIWKRGSYLKRNGHICLIQQTKESELTVKAYGPRPENLVLMVHEMFETLILESFQGITYDFFLPCPDCLKLAAKDPHMFPASIIRRATELKSPFLQCLKYFHTISITDLHAIMPPDSNQDFDLHLVQAVRGMKELQKNLVADVFVSFCELDNELTSTETLTPSRIIGDVEKLGYKCWIPKESKDSMDEMAKALLDAKIFMVFVSNNYVENENCCNLFKYARQTLRKDMIFVAVGENDEWKRSKLGILFPDELYVDMKKASRYEHKKDELAAKLKEKHAVESEGSKTKSFPPCFISYCWQNSAKAVAKGSSTTEGAVGYGDPRDIKDYLESKGVHCWIDVERVGQHGLFEDIGEGLIHSRLVVVCMSDQYAASDTCAKEFRYAVKVLKLPVVLAVVGTGNKWRASELGMLSLNCPLVSFQERSDSALDKLVREVGSFLPKGSALKESEEERRKREKDETNKLIQEQQRLSFQELCELAQRKFLRQISEFSEQLDPTPYPNIILVDFWAEEKKEKEELTSGRKTLPSASGRKRSHLPNGPTDFYDEQFCVHLLCEHEEGWHMSGKAIPLSENFGRNIDQYVPYIARITTIAKYSKKMVLNSQATDVGHSYLKWLEENPTVKSTTDFCESYGSLRQVIRDVDPKYHMSKLERCLLPSGKYIWLCEAHRRAMRVTVLTRESAVTTVHHQSEVLGVDFMLQELQDLEPLGLGKRLKQRAENLTRGDQLSPKKDSTQSETVAAVRPQEPTGSQSNTSEPNPQKDAEIPGERRPTLIRSNTTSRACLLM